MMKETNQIIRVVKELFQKNVNNSKELSKLINKYNDEYTYYFTIHLYRYHIKH